MPGQEQCTKKALVGRKVGRLKKCATYEPKEKLQVINLLVNIKGINNQEVNGHCPIMKMLVPGKQEEKGRLTS